MQNDNLERGRKIRFIAITCITAVLILAALAFGIVTTTFKKSPEVTNNTPDKVEVKSTVGNGGNQTGAKTAKTNTNTATKKTTSNKSSKTAGNAEDKKAATKKAEEQTQATAQTTTTNTATLPGEADSDIPQTGPAEMGATAILMGISTFLAINLWQKRNA